MTGLFWFVLGILTGAVVVAFVVLALWESLLARTRSRRRRGFVSVSSTSYAPGTAMLDAMREAADAEFGPGGKR